MSFNIAGITFTPKVANEHAQAMLSTINGVRQSLGLSLLTASDANAIWLILLAAGARNQVSDEVSVAGFNSLNPSLCDDNQILNLLPMVGTQRTPATYSTAVITVTVANTGQPITIPAGSILPFGSVNFLTDTLYTNATPPATFDLAVTCDTIGAIVCPAGSLTSFSPPITNVGSVTNADDAAVGVNEETIAHVRARVIRGDTIPYGVNAAIRNLRSLNGITNANVFFNNSSVDDLTLPGGIIVSPRSAYIVLTGYSDEIANAYFTAMDAPTSGAETQNYITLAGQEIPVSYDIATSQNIWVRVYYESSAPTVAGFESVIKQTIVDSQNELLPGNEVTAQYFSEVLANFTLATITGCTVSVDNVTFGRVAEIDANTYPSITTARVSVLGE